ncbi:HEPN domain-containing protein [Pseudanabaena sp. UWO311]|uniref:HEPN domain-containing protein n=1 Tax=Pseudanabaena sp. UWO311 TaxID=2487337 RepID=UPI0011593756|nr:HEPN domain-containing protein [Pseudanabaena sp. UWO311]TYQ24490.1 HEPN domain-containing protein [Pseudanabaena sp. UWO311]
MDSKDELVQNWLIKAQHDLLAAKKLSIEPEIYGDIAIYHCQQSAEKAVKGFLILHDQEFPRTHDIRLLIQLAIRINSSFEHYQETSEILTPYATEFRYPSDVMQPNPEELEDALIKAEELFDFVNSLLPDKIKIS